MLPVAGAARSLSPVQRGLLLQLLLFRGKRRRDASTPLIFEIDGILLVDLLLLFRRRIGAGDIEASVLHEIEIGIAAARLAAAGEFRIAFGKPGPLASLLAAFSAMSAHSSKSDGPRDHHCALACDDESTAQPMIAAIRPIWLGEAVKSVVLRWIRGTRYTADCRHYWRACRP